MKNKKGISLITLILTIVVIVILATAIIISLAKTNIIENANKAVEESKKGTAKEEINLATGELFIEQNLNKMTKEERREELENKLKEYDSSTTVEITETGFTANHRGYEFEISDNYEISIKESVGTDEEIFDAAEWDKTATDESLFIWDEAGTSIIGYSEQLAGNEKIRIPSKCIGISANSVWVSSESRSVISAGIKKIELPETIVTIGDYAFSEFKDLREINVPKRVSKIGGFAFYKCTSLTSIIIPEGVTYIGNATFDVWTSNQIIYCEVTSKPSTWGSYWNGYNCAANIVWGYKSLSGFNAAEWDKTATPDEYFEWDETGTIITGYKETIANNLTKIRIPSKCVAIIPDLVWQSSSNTRSAVVQGVKKVEIPETVTVIGSCAFADFTDTEEINIPSRVSSIGTYAFSRCSGLKSITIPDSITNIENYAFSYCSGMTSIVIPNSVTIIGSGAFYGWTSNQTIYCRASSQPSGWNSYWYSYGYGDVASVEWGYKGE